MTSSKPLTIEKTQVLSISQKLHSLKLAQMRQKILFLLPFLYLIILLFQVDGSLTTDLGRQLKMGEIIFHCHCVPQVNIFSLTNPNFHVINYSWLSELFFFLLANSFGLKSLLYLKFMIVIITFTIVYSLAFNKNAPFASSIFSLFTLAIFSERFDVRPELFSYLFIALFLLMFALYKRKQKIRYLWLLPIVLIIWTNMHIYFFIGVLLYLFFLAEHIILKRKFTFQLLILNCCILFAPLVNPAFIQGAIYPITIWHNYGYSVIENYPPLIFVGTYPFSVGICLIILFELLSCFALAGILMVPKKGLILEKLSTFFGLFIGQIIFRGMAIFSLLSLAFLIKEYLSIRDQASLKFKKIFGNRLKILVIIIYSLFFIYQLLTIHYSPGFGFGYETSAEKGVDFFTKNNLHGAIFNNFSTGNYLIYRLYPKEHVFLDGRPEAYPVSFFTMYLNMLLNNAYFNKQTNRYHINVVVFGLVDNPDLTRPFLLRLAKDNRWAPVYWDGRIVIFVRNTSENAKLISANNKIKKVLLKALQ